MGPSWSRVACALALIVGLPGLPGATATTARPPSILVFLADDMATGDADWMPAVQDLLVRQGASFSRFLVSTPLCCPSRATILRGQYAHNHGVLHNYMPIGGYRTFQELGLESSTVGTWLQEAGYRTAYIGKYLNGYLRDGDPAHVPPGWDEWLARGERASFGYTLNDNGRVVHFGDRPGDYFTSVLSDRAAEFLQRAGADGVPFLALVATSAPHRPARPAPGDEGEFDGFEAPRPPSFNEIGFGEKPTFVRRRRPLARREIEHIDRLYRNRLESLQAVDRMVARLVGVLESAGRLDDTYVFFLSDNGFHLGERRLMPGKVAPYDEDVRVPLFVRGPGVPPDASLPHIAGNTDLAPTLAAIAGIEPPSFVDGRSLLPLLGPDPPTTSAWRQSYLLEYAPRQRAGWDGAELYRRWRLQWQDDPEELSLVGSRTLRFFDSERRHARESVPGYTGVRTAAFTFVEYATGEYELFEDASDPYQLSNQFGYRSLNQEPEETLLNRVRWLVGRTGDEVRLAEDQPVPDHR